MTRARAGCSTIWPLQPTADACRRPPSWMRAAAPPRAHLAVAAGAGRRAARRLLAPSGARDRRCHDRAGAAAQAVAVAGLFADRAAAGGRHRGDRHRRPDGPRRIPQRRAAHRHGRPAAARSERSRGASTTSPRRSSSNGARSRWRCSTGSRRWCAQRLGRDAASFPLAKVLQGGTWAAGREIARARRADGSPPIKVVSDGTVF